MPAPRRAARPCWRAHPRFARRAPLAIITCEAAPLPAPPPSALEWGAEAQRASACRGGGAAAGKVQRAPLRDVGKKAPVPRCSPQPRRMFGDASSLRAAFSVPSARTPGRSHRAGVRQGGKAAHQLSPSWARVLCLPSPSPPAEKHLLSPFPLGGREQFQTDIARTD